MTIEEWNGLKVGDMITRDDDVLTVLGTAMRGNKNKPAALWLSSEKIGRFPTTMHDRYEVKNERA